MEPNSPQLKIRAGAIGAENKIVFLLLGNYLLTNQMSKLNFMKCRLRKNIN